MSRLMQRVGTGLWACSLFACTTFGVGYSWPVVAAEPIYVPSDGSLFWADIKDIGFTYEAFGETLTAGYEFSAGERSAIEQGLEYWQLLLQDNAQNSAPLRIMVIPSADAFNNASGLSDIVVSGPFAGKSWLAAALADNWFGESGSDWDDYLGFVWIDHVEHGDWYTGPLDSLPQNGSTLGLTATIVHEIGHALGISALANESATIESFGSSLNLWEQGLRDSYGQKAAPNMSVVSSGNKGEGTFVTQGETAYSGVYFTGEHVEDVLQGALLSYPENPDDFGDTYAGKMPGLPINAWEYTDEGGNENGYFAELSHIELQNSLLSHQLYRNWNTLMEAEIALMQDIGLSIDRRAWYGYSIYNSGLTLTNNHPFYARENGQYIVGQPSTMPWGIGLHVYGSNNHITQQADLLADGSYAVGVRLEGQNNDLSIANGTRVQANGYGGSALLVSYGRNHQIQIDGSAVALGTDGIAARFDFGDNVVGSNFETRGSWIRTAGAEVTGDYVEHANLPSEIQGALVNSFNVAGTLAGSKAAIFISENALVERINILSGASVWGDIVSEWDPNNSLIQTEHQNFSGTKDSLYTQLTFGQRQDSDGHLYDDASYDFTMYGNISGQGIKLNHRAGRLALAGTVDVYAVSNNGTMALYGVDQNGYAISTTSFTNGSDATLEAGFTVDGRITRIQADQAQLAGALALRPQTALYANEQKIDLGPVLTAESVSGAFEHTVVADYSPTLDFSLQQNQDNYQVTVSRKADAYSQHAANDGAASLGRALAQIASQVQSPEQSLFQTSRVSTTESSADHSDHSDHSDMDELLVALDWSDPDGHEVTKGLNALGANAYDIAARASLNQQSTFNSMLLQRQLSQLSPQEKQAQPAGPAPAQPVAAQPATAQLPQLSQQGQASVVPMVSEWNVWITPYASGMWQSTASNTTSWSSQSYGLMLGTDKDFKSGLKLGAHLIATDQRTKAKDELRATIESNAVLLGVHGSYAPDEWHGGWLAAQARVGVESSDMERTVAINGYVNSHESSWTGVIGSVLLGGGKDWQWQWQAQGQEREQSNSLLSVGPLAFVEYSFLQRPALDESKGNSSRLGVDRELYDSLRLNVGAHMSYDTVLSNGASFGVELLTAVRYELQDEFKTGAHFSEYSDISFTSQNELPSNDSLLVQWSLRFSSPDSAFFARMDVGGELSRDDYRALQVGLQLGWYF